MGTDWRCVLDIVIKLIVHDEQTNLTLVEAMEYDKLLRVVAEFSAVKWVVSEWFNTLKLVTQAQDLGIAA